MGIRAGQLWGTVLEILPFTSSLGKRQIWLNRWFFFHEDIILLWNHHHLRGLLLGTHDIKNKEVVCKHKELKWAQMQPFGPWYPLLASRIILGSSGVSSSLLWGGLFLLSLGSLTCLGRSLAPGVCFLSLRAKLDQDLCSSPVVESWIQAPHPWGI